MIHSKVTGKVIRQQEVRTQAIYFLVGAVVITIFLYIVSLESPEDWYLLMAVIGSYVTIDLAMNGIVQLKGTNASVLFQKTDNAGIIYIAYILGIIFTTIAVAYVLQDFKELVSQGLSLIHYSFLASLLVAAAAGLSLSVNLGDVESQ